VDVRDPKATRPWQHVLEPLSGYLVLGRSLYDSQGLHGQAFNFGPPANQDHSVEQLINLMSEHWENFRWNDVSDGSKFHEAGLLKLNCDKALLELKWQPSLNFVETIKMTVDWYKEFYGTKNGCMNSFTRAQIVEYSNLALKKEIDWARQC
jgi:CDP-glucose 4,6-dehydratase